VQAAKARLDAAENFQERRETLSALAAATETELAEAGLILAKSRRKAAVALRRDVTTALSSLAMEGYRFDVSLSWESISSDEVIQRRHRLLPSTSMNPPRMLVKKDPRDFGCDPVDSIG
jgi:DNA repair ATPase RecN